MKTTLNLKSLLFIFFVPILIACAAQREETVHETPVGGQPGSPASIEAEFTLKTIAENGKLLYIGMGGDIDGIVNPDLTVQPGAIVRIILINGDGMTHDLFLPDFDVKTSYVSRIGEKTDIIFETGNMQPDTYTYYCTLPGHRQAGQEGKIVVSIS